MKTRLVTSKISTLVCLAALFFCAANLPAQSPVILEVNTNDTGRLIPPDFCGLSYELKMVLTNSATGKYYFSRHNRPLINTFETLGIKHLRVGGNTAERAGVPIPDQADIDSLFGFVRAAGLKAIYTVRMTNNSPADAAAVAKYVMDKYKPYVACLTVGNEPDKSWKYPAWLEQWRKFTGAILQSAPDAKFCGPSATQAGVEWSKLFADDIGEWEHLAYLTQHYYPLRNGDGVTNATRSAAGRQQLLSPDMYSIYQKFYDVFGPETKAKGIGYRLEESNSYSHGGANGVSDTFTASLWIVDYLYWWAWHDALGINFHTGEKVTRGLAGPDRPNVYTAFTTSTNGLTVLPTGYGMKLFNLGSQGRLVPATVVSNVDNVNLAAYATLDSHQTLRITILNKEHGPAGRSATLTINAGMPSARASMIYMTAPQGDITSISGITIGGSGINENGIWHGKWTRLPTAGRDGSITVTVPAATGVVIKLEARHGLF
jgi:hypothetical protein